MTILTKSQFSTIKQSWSNIKVHTASEHVIYNALRNKELDLGFTKIIRVSKLKNINNPMISFENAKEIAKTKLNPRTFFKDENRKHLSKLFGIEFNDELCLFLIEILNNQ